MMQPFIFQWMSWWTRRQKLTKEMEAAKKQLAQCTGKLNNQGFLSKAPANVVEGVKADAERLSDRIALIETSLAALQ